MTNAHTFKIKWPLTGNEIEIRMEPAYYDRLLIYHPTHFMNICTAYAVLQSPKRIFSGIRRPVTQGDEKFCVVGKPDAWYVNETQKVSFPRDKVFVVYLSGRFSIYDFGAEFTEHGDLLSPINFKTRFGDLEWTVS